MHLLLLPDASPTAGGANEVSPFEDAPGPSAGLIERVEK
jgi:hypothetical protein